MPAATMQYRNEKAPINTQNDVPKVDHMRPGKQSSIRSTTTSNTAVMINPSPTKPPHHIQASVPDTKSKADANPALSAESLTGARTKLKTSATAHSDSKTTITISTRASSLR